MPRLLVITTDDLGYGPERDRGIFELLHAGVVTSVSLLVSAAHAREAAGELSARGLWGNTGLHLNLTEGCAVSEEPLSTLVERDTRRFRFNKFEFREMARSGVILAADVAAETRAQLKRFCELSGGMLPSHIDGHQHVHVVDGVRQAIAQAVAGFFAEVKGREPLPDVRIPHEMNIFDWVQPEERRNFYSAVSNDALAARECYSRTLRVRTSHFLGMCLTGRDLDNEHLWSSLLLIPSDAHCVELMIHPGYAERGDEEAGRKRARSDPPRGSSGGFPPEYRPDDFAMSKDREHELNFYRNAGEAMQIMTEAEGFKLVARSEVPPILPLKEEEARKTVVILSSATPFTGNHSTACRLRDMMVSLGMRCCVSDANALTSRSAFDALVRDELRADLVIAIHAYRAGRFLVEEEEPSPPCPYVLVLGGTDVNEMCDAANPEPVYAARRETIRKAMRGARAVIAFTPAMAERARVVCPERHSPLRVIPQSVVGGEEDDDDDNDVDRRSRPCGCPLRELLPPGTYDEETGRARRKICLLPAGLRAVKDPLYLWDVITQQLYEEVELVMVGPILDQALGEEVRARCAASPNVHFLGPMLHPRLVRTMACCADFVLNTSHTEGMSNTLLEAMRVGRGVVLARDNEGNRSVVRDGETGWLFASPSQFEARIRGALKDPDACTKMRRAARRFVRKNFSYDEERRAYSGIMKTLI